MSEPRTMTHLLVAASLWNISRSTTIKDDKPYFNEASFWSIAENVFNVNKAQIKGASRKRKIVWIRQLYCYMMRLFTESTFKEIGAKIERDHSTVINSTYAIQDMLDVEDSDFLDIYNVFFNQLNIKSNERR